MSFSGNTPAELLRELKMDKNNTDTHIRAIEVVNQLSIAIRTAQIHSHNNIAVTSAIDKLTSLINDIFDHENTFVLSLSGEYYYFNDCRVRYAFQYVLSIDFLVRAFRKSELGTITIKSKVSFDEIKTFLTLFIESAYSATPFLSIKKAMSGIPKIKLEEFKQLTAEETIDVKKMVRKSYFNAVSQTKGIGQNIRNGEKVNLKRAKRVVTSMVNHLLEEEPFLLGMTAIKEYDEYTYHHSVNVSILSVALGHRMGLQRKRLIELGMVSLFHDIGKIDIPNEILNKPAALNDDEWIAIKKHPIRGAMAILNIRRLDDLTANASIVAYEHHKNYDHSGYPVTNDSMDTDLYSRIVSLTDRYDAMTSARIYSRTPMSPHKALSLIKEEVGTKIDPVVFRFFVSMVGVYPVGTLIMLDTEEVGLVLENNQLFLSRPRVLLLTDNHGERIDSYLVDLTEKDRNGISLRTIQKTMDHRKYDINIAEHLLALKDADNHNSLQHA